MDLVSGAGVGAIAGELLKALLNAEDKAASFKSYFSRLEKTLAVVIPLVDQIQCINEQLDRSQSETSRLIALLQDGKGLVSKCAKVHSWDVYRRYRYSKKILKLEESLLRFVNVDMSVAGARDNKEVLQEVRSISHKLDRLTTGSSDGDDGEGWLAAGELPSLTVGLELALREVKDELNRDGVSVLVVSGPPGSGKTTLASKLCREKDIKAKFMRNIFFATVSSTPNWKSIAQNLCTQLGSEPLTPNDESAINALTFLLRQRHQSPTLLVLDDIFPDSGSQHLLHKLLEQPLPGCCKVLITSRSTFPTIGCTYHMRLLDHEDAMTLFHHIAFPEEGMDKPDNNLIEKVVKHCNGFPLAIKVVACSLRRQPEAIWRDIDKEWSKGPSIFDYNTYLHDRLATTLEFLKDLVKECFLDLGLFLEDQMIPATSLIDIWAELYDVDEDKAYVILLELSTLNLARLVSTGKDVTEVEECYNELFVTQHDLLRELAIYKSSQGEIQNWKRTSMRGSNISNCSIKEPFGAQLLSIFVDADLSSSSWADMKLPKLEVLILNVMENCTLPPCKGEMSKVKVLILRNHGFSHVELPHSLWLDSFSNLRRLRLEKVSLPSFDKIAIQMKNLRKISLVLCEIGEAFRSCSVEIANVMMPNIVEVEIDYCDDLEELSGGLCSLISLKKLSITNCHKLHSLPLEISLMENLEALRLRSCSGLLHLPASIGALRNLDFLDVSGCISLEELPEQVCQLSGLRKLDMRGCPGLNELPATCVNLKQLKQVICDEETASLWKNFQSYLKDLQVKLPKEKIDLTWLQI